MKASYVSLILFVDSSLQLFLTKIWNKFKYYNAILNYSQILFQLPNAMKDAGADLTDLFIRNRKIIPWFPSVLIGQDFSSAVEFLEQSQPRQIVTNNIGIAYEAWQKGIPWMAGPNLNLANSFSLVCLKENFNCAGAYLSNEISKTQMKQIQRPDGFKLYFSIYQPLVLMTSRQCLFYQIIGCEKSQMDESCIRDCKKSASITNTKAVEFQIEKTKGNYNCVYNAINLLNTDIVADFPDLFSGFMIDLSDIKTETQIELDKPGIIQLFENLINGNSGSAEELQKRIYPTTNKQYKTGI